jgi:hypothetical protein
MFRRKYILCGFFVSVLILLIVSISMAEITIDDMVDVNMHIPSVDYDDVNTSHKVNADAIQTALTMYWLEFDANNVDWSKVSVWSNNTVINTVLQLHQTRDLLLGFENGLRAVSKDGVIGVDVTGLVSATGILYLIDADDVLEEIIEDVRGRVFVAVINGIIKSGEYRLGHILARLLVHYDRFDDYSDALSYAR